MEFISSFSGFLVAMIIMFGFPGCAICAIIFAIIRKNWKKPLKIAGILFALMIVLVFIGSSAYAETDSGKQALSENNKSEETEKEIENDVDVEEDVRIETTEEILVASIEESLIYEGNNVCIYVKGIERTDSGYDLSFYIENGSELNLGFNAHSYAINKINTGNNIYDMDCDVAAGKKANTKLSLSDYDLMNIGVSDIKSIDILFWAYDNDKYFKEFDTGQITINTNLYNDEFEKLEGTTIYDSNGVKVDYINKSKNKYTYCITNSSGYYMDFDVENITINDFTSSDIDYDLIGVSVLNDCQALFVLEISNEFMTLNSISEIEKIEFSLKVCPLESHLDSWKTETIILEF
ncbi:MAG: hypothetical protein IJZ23_02175 [Roseburia sp.]|nr:hypothetical protein [Roseburia sp.]